MLTRSGREILMEEKTVKSPQEVEGGRDGIPLGGQGESHQRHRVARNRRNTTATAGPSKCPGDYVDQALTTSRPPSPPPSPTQRGPHFAFFVLPPAVALPSPSLPLTGIRG